MKLGSLFKILSTKTVWKAPSGGLIMTSYPVGNKTLLSRILDKSWYGTLSWSHGHSFRIRHEKSRKRGEITMTSYPACNKTPLSLKPCISNKKLVMNTFMKSWLLSNFYKKQNFNINSKTYQFINVVNGVSHSHKTANLFFHLTQ